MCNSESSEKTLCSRASNFRTSVVVLDTILNNKIDNFSEIQIDLNIEDERKWKKIILNTNISEQQDKSFTYDAKFTNATLRIQNKS